MCLETALFSTPSVWRYDDEDNTTDGQVTEADRNWHKK